MSGIRTRTHTKPNELEPQQPGCCSGLHNLADANSTPTHDSERFNRICEEVDSRSYVPLAAQNASGILPCPQRTRVFRVDEEMGQVRHLSESGQVMPKAGAKSLSECLCDRGEVMAGAL